MTRLQIVIQVDGETVGGPIDDIPITGPQDAGLLVARLRHVADRIELWRQFRAIVPKDGDL